VYEQKGLLIATKLAVIVESGPKHRRWCRTAGGCRSGLLCKGNCAYSLTGVDEVRKLVKEA
jgi:hypothetical protein